MSKDKTLSGFYAFLATPLFFRSRLVLAALVVPLLLAFVFPLWRFELQSPQFPDGLTLDVYAHTVKGGHDGADIRDLNILNHSMGVHALVRRELSDLDWIPFLIGLLAILTLRCAAIGEVRSLVDVVVLTLYAGLFAAVRFAFALRAYGHELDPDAPKHVEPFAPPMFGTSRIGDLTSSASPHLGTAFVLAFLIGAAIILIVHLRAGRASALAADKPALAAAPASEPRRRSRETGHRDRVRGALVAACEGEAPSPGVASGATASAAATAPCTPRSAEKLGFHFVRICPPGEPGFWISAVPIGCSAGRHDEMSCPMVTPIAQPIGRDPAPIASTMAAVIDWDTAGRLCFFRMGGRLPTRAERSHARELGGLSTVLVVESAGEAERFRFEELTEWVFESPSKDCTEGVPRPQCVHGWFPADSRGASVPWAGMRACSATHRATAQPGVVYANVGAGCAVPAPAWSATGEPVAISCGVRSAAFDPVSGPNASAFTLSCTAPTDYAHPASEAKDVAAYRCVVPESALGSFDVAGR